MTAYWPPYAESLRGLPACPCQIAWIPMFEKHLNLVIPTFRGTLGFAQLIGTFSGSGSTHGDPNGEVGKKGGGLSDFWVTGNMARLVVAEARKAGADPTWHRGPGWDGPGSDEHIHSGLRGCPHRTESALAQEWAVDHNGDGLVGNSPDPGPRPLSGRTWQQGIEWMEDQDMAGPKDWDTDDWAAVKKFLEEEPMIDIKDPVTKKTKKTVSITDALQREVND